MSLNRRRFLNAMAKLAWGWDMSGAERARVQPDLRLVNLETAVTISEGVWLVTASIAVQDA